MWVLPFVWMFWVDKNKAKVNREAKSQFGISRQFAAPVMHDISFVDDSSDDNDWGESTVY